MESGKEEGLTFTTPRFSIAGILCLHIPKIDTNEAHSQSWYLSFSASTHL